MSLAQDICCQVCFAVLEQVLWLALNRAWSADSLLVCTHPCMELDCALLPRRSTSFNCLHPFAMSTQTPAWRTWYKVKCPVLSVSHARLKTVATCWYEKSERVAVTVLCDRAGSSVCTYGDSRRQPSSQSAVLLGVLPSSGCCAYPALLALEVELGEQGAHLLVGFFVG